MSENNRIPNLEIEGARIVYRNFSGKPSKFNNEGDRNFCVIIDDPVQFENLQADGWNVKCNNPDDEEKSMMYMKVKVNLESYAPPRIKMIIGEKSVSIDENNIELLDGADIAYCDMVISPYQWEMNGNSGISAYLKELYVICNTSKIGEKYADYE